MKRLEKILILFAAGSAVLKFTGSHESVFTLVLSLLVLSFFYLAGSFWLFKDGSSPWWFRTASGTCLFALCISFVLRFLYWPENEILFVISISVSCLLVAVFYFIRKSYRLVKAEQRIIPFLVAGIIFFSVPVRTLLSIQYDHDPERATLQADVYEDPGNSEKEGKLKQHILNQIK